MSVSVAILRILSLYSKGYSVVGAEFSESSALDPQYDFHKIII